MHATKIFYNAAHCAAFTSLLPIANEYRIKTITTTYTAEAAPSGMTVIKN